MHTTEKDSGQAAGSPPDPIFRVRALFADQGLPFPPLPPSLESGLRQTGEHTFASRDALPPLYALDAHLTPLRQGTVTDYVALGFDGHGINSWAMHFYLVAGPVAMFLQCRWDNVYDDQARAKERMEGVFGLAERLILDLEQAQREGRLAGGQRMLLCFSDFTPSGWGWQHGGEWHDDGELTFLSAIGAIEELSAARH
jgi:hypothetical protein